MALNHRPVFADKKVIICALNVSFRLLSNAKSCCLSDREKSSVLLNTVFIRIRAQPQLSAHLD